MINHLINELVNYGLKNGLIDLADEVYVCYIPYNPLFFHLLFY